GRAAELRPVVGGQRDGGGDGQQEYGKGAAHTAGFRKVGREFGAGRVFEPTGSGRGRQRPVTPARATDRGFAFRVPRAACPPVLAETGRPAARGPRQLAPSRHPVRAVCELL